MSSLKQCSKCGEWKKLEDFYKCAANKLHGGYQTQCAECHAKLRRESQNKEPGKSKHKARCINRREIKLKCGDGKLSEKDISQIKEKFHYCCFNCGMTEEEHYKVYNTSLHLDHHYPLTEHHHPLKDNNGVPLCEKCNGPSGKWYQHPEVFYTLCQRIDLHITYGIVNLRDRDYQI